LKRVGVAAAKFFQAKPAHVSANAFKFKVIPASEIQSRQGRATEASVNTDEEAEIDDGSHGNDSDAISASKSHKRSHIEHQSSLPAAHSSPGFRSSSPVAPQRKAKSRKRSHADFRSSSPAAHSFRSSSPVARSGRSSSPVIPLQKKAKNGPQLAPSAPKSQPTIPVYREGAEINHKKPKASDYEDIVHALILRAASQYEASVSTKNSFPDTAQRLKWAQKSWSDANNDADHEFEITDEISSLVNLSNLI
jgi:hypothetical protein